MKLNTPFI